MFESANILFRKIM